MRKLFKNRSGSMFVYMLFILMFLFLLTGLVGEIYRVHSIQSHLEYELQRAVNIAVEDAMRDSFRQDGESKLNTTAARQDLNTYLAVHLGLNAARDKVQDGRTIYTVRIDTLDTTVDPPRMHIEGTILIPSQISLFATNVEVPFDISSRNRRTD